MSIAEQVRHYLENRPYILEAIEKGIVNLSQLSRTIHKEIHIEKMHALKSALRRHANYLKMNRRQREETVIKTLHESKLGLLDNLSVIVSNQDLKIDSKLKVEQTNHQYVYLIEKRAIPRIDNRFKNSILKIHEECTALIISAPERIERITGVTAYLTTLLAWQNITTFVYASSHTETTLVVARKDALNSYKVLSRIIG